MKRFVGVLALAAASMMATSANAAVLFSDSLQNTLAAFPTNTSGQIVTAPTGGKALNFASNIGGGDLFTSVLAGTGVGTYRLNVSYLCQTVGGCGAYIGLHPGGTVTTAPPTQFTDNWLATDTPAAYPAPFLLTSTGSGFTTNSFLFSVTSPGSFGLKLEDYTTGPGDAYFRNLSLSAVPEPATWVMMIGGFGVIGGMMHRRRANPALHFA